MKKILYKFLLPFAFLSSLSVSAFAIDEILITAERCPHYGSCLTGNDMYWYMLLNYASWRNYAYSGSPQSVANEEAKKKKEEAVRQCNANAGGNFYLCRNKVNAKAIDDTAACGALFLNDNLIAQCNLGVTLTIKSGMDVCEGNHEIAKEACNRL